MGLQKLVAAMALVGALDVGYANALGLGEVRLNSALNQPLDAEIELLQIGELTRNEILPNLATGKDFKLAGLDRAYSLAGLQFKTILRSDGTGYIHVTSRELVREPFFNFLLELHWPSGRLLREYTLLLDPPTFGEQSVKPVAPPTKVSTYPVLDDVQHQSANPFDRKVSRTQQQRSWQPAIPAPEMGHSKQPSQPSVPVSRQTRSVSGSDDYRVQYNENLWNIARKIRPSKSLSIQQTMLAIQKQNPDAFVGGNINRLKKGQVLRMPSRNDIVSISFEEAVREVGRQHREWQMGRGQIDATRRHSAAPKKHHYHEDGQLSIVSGGGASGFGRDLGDRMADAEQAALQNELTVTGEKLDQITRENAELRSRLGDLDGQIETLKRLIQLKDNQMAALQQPPMAEAQPHQQPEPVQPAKAQSGFMAFLFSNPLYLILAGLIPVGLAGGLVFQRHKKKEHEKRALEDEFVDADDEAPVDLGNNNDVVEEELEFNKRVLKIDNEPVEEPSKEPLKEPRKELLKEKVTQQTEDVLSEADIYIAYGRFPQAVELLTKAIADEPERADLRLKLLEVHAENNDIDSFRDALEGVERLGDPGAVREAEVLKQKFPAGSFNEEEMPSVTEAATDEHQDALEDFDLEAALEDSNVDPDEGYDLDDEEQQAFPPDVDEIEENDELSFNLDDTGIDSDDLGEFADNTEQERTLPPELNTSEPPSRDASSETMSFGDGMLDFEAALDDDFDFLSDDDETETKLDLARAYFDMGDQEGAREILQEVLESGSDEQKAEAQNLLDQAS